MQRIKKAYAENGDLKIIPDTPPLDGSENWEQGRGAYYELDNDPNTGDPLALDIDREQDNYFKNVISKNIKHWQENTYPDWFNDIEYPKNATVKYTDGNIYVSKVDSNTALPTDTTKWVNFEDFGSLNINTLPDKPTPDDTDNFAIQEAGGDLKKVSYKNLFDKVSITGSATFNGTTQTIDLTGIGNITLEIGDVIEVTGTTSNNKLFTVESIPNVNQIIVNYEHRGTSTPAPKGRLVNETATATIKLYNRAKNAQSGQGQYWCSPASGRAKDIEYENTTNREIKNSLSWVSGNSGAFTIFRVDGFAPQHTSAGTSAGTYTYQIGETSIPAGSKYSLQLPSGTIQYWLELR